MSGLDRRGVTLVELMIGLVLASIVGASMIRISVEQARFNERTEAARQARAVSRTAINFVTSELRMADANGGIVDATTTRVRVRVPFAVGLICRVTSTAANTPVIAAFMPVDSTLYSMGYNGFAVRSPATGYYAYYGSNATVPADASGSSSTCTGSPANMTLMTGHRVLSLNTPSSLGWLPTVATPITLFKVVEYEFAASTLIPGRTALWRRLIGNAGTVTSSEELAAPFDANARFRFYINNDRIPSDTLPTSLDDIRGLEFLLSGESERTARQRLTPEQANLSSSVFFLNRLD